MKTQFLLFALPIAGACSAAVLAGIPEPDYILHGQMCIAGTPASANDDVTIIAKAIVTSQLREVGRYKMGDNESASDCNGDTDCYVLRVRLETVPSGETPSGTAVVLDRANPALVLVYLIQGDAPQQLITTFRVADSGTIQRLDLRDVPATADLNGDGRKDLSDYQMFRTALQGPDLAPPGACNSADLNGDGHVDMRDFSLMQASFTG